MEEAGKRIILMPTPQLDHHPELINRIQSLLPVKDAARTCILSKSWLHSWSTIPTFRFPLCKFRYSKPHQEQHEKHVKCTLDRYPRDNLPIERLHLHIDIVTQDLASHVEKWIRPIASKSCLKELSLSIQVFIDSLTLPDEILSGKNLNKITVSGICRSRKPDPLRIDSNVVISCVSLRVLKFYMVDISEELIHNLLSTCSLLETIELVCCKGLKTIKVKNLRCLCKFQLFSVDKFELDSIDVLEIEDVPNLRWFHYGGNERLVPFNMDSLASVTHLTLEGVIMDDAFFDMLKSKLPFLGSLTLGMGCWRLDSIDITCVSLKRLSLRSADHRLVNVRVNAPKLVYFRYDGRTMPSLLFPSIAPDQIEVKLHLYTLIGNSFFLKMREALVLPSKFNIEITIPLFGLPLPFNIDVDDLRRGVLFPATNVQVLSFKTYSHPSKTLSNEGLGEQSAIIDAFFWICHPKCVVAWRGNNGYYFCNLLLRNVMEKKITKTQEEGSWHDYLKDVELRSHYFEKWETQTDSWTSFLDGSTTHVKWNHLKFIPNWYSSS